MMKFKGLIFLTIAVFFNTVLFAQVANDAIWTGAGARLKVNKKLDVDIEAQLRFNDRYSSLNNIITQAGISYELTDRISAKTTFRYYINPGDLNKYRYTGDLSYNYSEKGFPWRFKYRIRFQNTIEESTKKAKAYIRNRFSVGYNLTKIADPYIAYEPYFKLNHINRFTVNRFYGGLEWKLLKNLELDTYFMYESEYGEKNKNITRVIGLSLLYSFRI